MKRTTMKLWAVPTADNYIPFDKSDADWFLQPVDEEAFTRRGLSDDMFAIGVVSLVGIVAVVWCLTHHIA